MFMGLLTIQLIIVYGIGLIIWNRGKIKSSLISYIRKRPWNILKDVLISYAITSAVMGVCLLLQDYGVITNVFKLERATVLNQFNHMGYYLNMSVLVMTGLFLMEDNKKRKILCTAGIAFQIYCLIVNNTFGGYLGTVVGVISVCLIYVMVRNSLMTNIGKAQ